MKTLRTLLGPAIITAILAAALLLAVLSPAAGAGVAVAEAVPTPAEIVPATAVTSVGSPNLARAYAALETLNRTYRYLDDVTIEGGTPPRGKQAVSFYTEGRIVIGADHSASVESIMMHEVWHIIDWRDNGRIDWAEDVPPSNSQDYLR